uniref:Uncharacterized protein n=1 Tax=Daucus carota subsp. sativus TaxID=79200 RepID=A0A165A182_DAUCS
MIMDFVENSTKEDFLEKSEKNKARAEGVEARYKKACLGYARLREMLTHQKNMNKERVQQAKEHKKLDDKENNKLAHKVNEKTRESVVGLSSRKLGYPLPGDICDDAVLDFVRLAVKFNRVTDVVVHMGNYWERDAWNDYINKENVLEVLDNQWLSATGLTFYIRYDYSTHNHGFITML